MSDLKTLLEQKARRPERTVFVCVAADLVDKHQTLNGELAELLTEERKATPARRMNEVLPSREKAEEVKAVEQEMADATVELRLRAVDPAEWRAWKNDHPAREGVDLDETFGLDSDALLADMVRRCIVSPEFDDEDWAKWTAEVANAEQITCGITVISMHEHRVDVPKSRLVSLVSIPSDDESKPQPDSE